MSSESSLARANELYVCEEYDAAAPLYDAALQQQPGNPTALIARAANSIKLKHYDAALRDADAALQVDGENSLALYRRATALFYLDDFSAALTAFQQAEQRGNKQSALFIRKCEAELRRSQPHTANAANTAAAPSPSVPTSPNVASVTSSTSQSGASPAASQPLSSRVKDSWFQTRHAVTITLFAKNLTRECVSVSVDVSSPHLLHVRVQLPDQSVYDKRWSLYAAVQPDSVKVDITAYRVEIIAVKQREEEWLGLLDSDRRGAEGVVQRDNVVRPAADAAAVTSYPTSSKKKVEWSEVESDAQKAEEAEKPEGDAALQKLFQTIYKDANEDTRRAMIKSFQTSGGTVLSTNWKEVGQTDYTRNREAPNGMEFKDWNARD